MILTRPLLSRLLDWLAPVAGRRWFPPLAALVAFAATVSMTVPTVPFLTAWVIVSPRRWVAIAFWAILGSALGGALLVHLLGHFGILFFTEKLPELMASAHWQHMVKWTSHHGWWVLILVAASPISQTPVLFLAAILGMPAVSVFLSLFSGKAVKYGVIAGLTSRGAERLALAHGFRALPEERAGPV